MFARLFDSQERMIDASAVWGEWAGDSAPVASGMRVTTTSAMQLLAVYGCVKLISDSISTLPVHTYRELSDGAHEELPNPYWLDQPTIDLDFPAWCGQVLTSVLLAGNAYIKVTRNDRNAIVELVPLDPAKVTVRREAGFKVFYINGIRHDGEILHMCGTMMPGSDVGLSPVEFARQTIGLGLAATEFGAKQFDGDYNMPGVIEAQKVMQPETKKAMAAMWRRNRSKAGRGLPGILDDGATWKQTAITNEQAQFLATRQFTDAQIAGQMFLIDPREFGISIQGGLDYTTIDSRNVILLQRPLLPWILRLEALLSNLMAAPRYIKLNLDGLRRADQKARWEVFEIGSRINTAAVALGMKPVIDTVEMREFEDWGPIPEQAPVPVAPVPVAPAVATPGGEP